MKTIAFTFFIISIFSSCGETKTASFDLNTLPKEWIKLTEKEGKLVVYNSCDAGNLLLTVKKMKGKFELLLHGQQEDYAFDILESAQLNDTLYIQTTWKDTEEKQQFNFIWTDKPKGIGRWVTTYPNGIASNNVFVVSQKQNSFEKVDQPCRECWGDACDEME